MKISISKSSFYILNKIYDDLKSKLISDHKHNKNQSILFTLNNSRSNYSIEKLNNSSQRIDQKELLEELIKDNLVIPSNQKLNMYSITAHGIWLIEQEKYCFKEIDILDYFQSRINSKSQKFRKPLKNDDKIILLSMISVRTFTEDNPMDLKDKKNIEIWSEIFKNSNNFLKKKNFVDISKKSKSYDKERDFVTYMVRHANDLPAQTLNKYKYTSNKKKYFIQLDFTNKDSIVNDLKFLFGLVFNKFNNIELLEECIDFFNQSAYNFGTFFHNKTFLTKDYDDLIKLALDRLYAEKG